MFCFILAVEKSRSKIQLATHETSDLESEDEEQAVFDIGDSNDEDDDEEEGTDDEDEDDDDEELDLETERAMRKLNMRKPFVDEDGILGVKEKKQVSEKAWGKKKTSYYQNEEEDEEGGSDEEVLKDEEDEARRIQREKYSAMQDEDFGGDVEDSFQSIISKKTPVTTEVAGKKGKKADKKVCISSQWCRPLRCLVVDRNLISSLY